MYKTDLFISALLQAARTVGPVCQFRASLALPDLFFSAGRYHFQYKRPLCKRGSGTVHRPNLFYHLTKALG